MKWYTKDNGVLCLVSEDFQFTNFYFTTNVIVRGKVNTSLNMSHIDVIGSFPEDWSSDKTISTKINRAAKHFFGLSASSNACLCA